MPGRPYPERSCDTDLPGPRGRRRPVRRARGQGHHPSVPHPGADAADGPRRRRPHRSGPHGHRQDARLRPAAPAARRHLGAPHAGPHRRPDARAVRAGPRGPPHRRRARHPLDRRLRRDALRGADRGARVRRPRRRRHAGASARPPQPRHARPVGRPCARPRRGGRDARHGLPARRRAAHRELPDRAAHDAVQRDDADRDREDGTALHEQPDVHPRRPHRGRDRTERRPALHARAPHGQAAAARAHPADPRARQRVRLRPHEAHGGPARRGPRRPRSRGDRDPRRPAPDDARTQPRPLPRGQGQRARRHRGRRARTRRRERDARRELRLPRGREDVPAPHRADRPRGTRRGRRHVRRAPGGRAREPDPPRDRPDGPRGPSDLLHLPRAHRAVRTARGRAVGALGRAPARTGG